MKAKFFIILLSFCFGFVHSQIKEDTIEMARIDKYVEGLTKKVKDYHFEKNEGKKIIKYEYSKLGDKIVRIQRKWKQKNEDYIDTYLQYFYLEKGKRVFAEDALTYQKENDSLSVVSWNCRFWIKNNNVIYIRSLGHGKTEDDSWDYDKELKENFEFMLKTVKKEDAKKGGQK